MKNVLFTTTAIAGLALSSAAFADAHLDNFTLTGESIVGYNDEIEGGLFFENDVTIGASADLGSGYSASANFGADTEMSETGETSASVTFDGASLETPAGTLSYDDDMDEATAAWDHYDDTEGMTDSEMPNADDDGGIKWAGTFGDFGYAVSTGGDDGDSDIPGSFSIGLGGTFGDVTVGLGYDEFESTMGVMAAMDIGSFNVKAAFQSSDGEGSSTGIQLSFDATDDISAGVYFASNEDSDDQYGVLLDYASGPLSVGVDIHLGADNFQENYELDVSYAVNDNVTLYAGHDNASDANYVGAEVSIVDGVSATIAYAEADEIGGPEFKDGTSAYLTISY